MKFKNIVSLENCCEVGRRDERETYIDLVVLACFSSTSNYERTRTFDRYYYSLVLLVCEDVTSDSMFFPTERIALYQSITFSREIEARYCEKGQLTLFHPPPISYQPLESGVV